MRVIGLAGKPGSGKSAVGRSLAERDGVEWIDLDKIAWHTYRAGTTAHERLVERFGSGILRTDGEIERARLAERALADERSRADLESIVHPAVTEWLRGEIADRCRAGTRVLLIEGALLAESPHVDRSLFDAILWFEAAAATREARLAAAGRLGHINRVPDPLSRRGLTVIDAEGDVRDIALRVTAEIDAL